tara:strand:+ start:64 stop:927 length:864 start_codon:yes stop_codon:yes gene_type:complete
MPKYKLDRGSKHRISNKWHHCDWEKDVGFFEFLKNGDYFGWGHQAALYLSEQIFPKFLENGHPRTTIDGGANYGAMTYPLAMMSEQVHAFEMREDVIECNKLNTKKFNNVYYHNVALSDKRKEATLFMDARSGLSFIWDEKAKNDNSDMFNYVKGEFKKGPIMYKENTIGGNFVGGDKSSYDAGYGFMDDTTDALDNYNLKNVDFIKLDVQFQELEVLQGAINIIKRDSPIIMYEDKGGRIWNDISKRNETKNFLIDLNYYPYELWGNDVICIHEKHVKYYRNHNKL